MNVNRLAAIFGVVVMMANVGCGGDTRVYPFQDESGRQCTRVCQDDGCSFTCDAEPMPTGGCGDDSEPGFTVHGGSPDTPAGLCDSCKTGGTSGYFLSDCVPLVCERDIDCAFGNLRCVEGYCWHDRFL